MAIKKVAFILAGCGARDGSEIQEATLALYALSLAGIEVSAFSLDAPQHDVVNFVSGESVEGESRNQLLESARIVRGAISPLSVLAVDDFDGLFIAGGTGTAKNLFTFAFEGLDFSVTPLYYNIVKSFHSAQKPIAAMCIAPLSLCAIISGVKVTLGAAGSLSESVAAKFGCEVQECDREGVVVDHKNKIATTPSYMYDDSTVANIGRGAQNLASRFAELF